MTERAPEQRTRRAFFQLCLAGGSAAAVGLGLAACKSAQKPRGALAPDDILYRNPAFRKHSTPEGTVVSTTASGDKPLSYRMDADAEALWDRLPASQGQRAAQEVTVAQLLDEAARMHKDRDPAVVQKEARAFLQEASDAGLIVVPPRRKAYIAREPYVPPIEKTR